MIKIKVFPNKSDTSVKMCTVQHANTQYFEVTQDAMFYRMFKNGASWNVTQRYICTWRKDHYHYCKQAYDAWMGICQNLGVVKDVARLIGTLVLQSRYDCAWNKLFLKDLHYITLITKDC
jgi:hypothetical protein